MTTQLFRTHQPDWLSCPQFFFHRSMIFLTSESKRLSSSLQKKNATGVFYKFSPYTTRISCLVMKRSLIRASRSVSFKVNLVRESSSFCSLRRAGKAVFTLRCKRRTSRRCPQGRVEKFPVALCDVPLCSIPPRLFVHSDRFQPQTAAAESCLEIHCLLAPYERERKKGKGARGLFSPLPTPCAPSSSRYTGSFTWNTAVVDVSICASACLFSRSLFDGVISFSVVCPTETRLSLDIQNEAPEAAFGQCKRHTRKVCRSNS